MNKRSHIDHKNNKVYYPNIGKVYSIENMKKTWRQHFAPIIAKIIADNEGKTVKELKKILCDLNPGPYGHHRKTWSNEYMRQLGLSKKRSTFNNNKQQLTLL